MLLEWREPLIEARSGVAAVPRKAGLAATNVSATLQQYDLGSCAGSQNDMK
jgi:hypothetical protein